jgi:hypothetical protein
MTTLMTLNVKERRERVMDKQGDLIKHRDLWKQSDLVDSPEIKLGNRYCFASFIASFVLSSHALVLIRIKSKRR